MAPLEQAEAIIKLIVDSIVDDTDAVKIEPEEAPNQLLFKICVAPQDVGKLIGKQGRTARSLRTIALAMGMKVGMRFSVDIAQNGRTVVLLPVDESEFSDLKVIDSRDSN